MIDRNAFLLVSLLLTATTAFGCEALADEPRDRCNDLARATAADRSGIEAHYSVTYTRVSGGCGELAIPGSVMFDGPRVESFLEFEVETQAILNGCSMFLAQIVRDRDSDQIQVVVDGSQLMAEDSDTIAGRVNAMRFSALGMMTCSGEYDARLERAVVVSGPAFDDGPTQP
jgi:hypothetical protein